MYIIEQEKKWGWGETCFTTIYRKDGQNMKLICTWNISNNIVLFQFLNSSEHEVHVLFDVKFKYIRPTCK